MNLEERLLEDILGQSTRTSKPHQIAKKFIAMSTDQLINRPRLTINVELHQTFIGLGLQINRHGLCHAIGRIGAAAEGSQMKCEARHTRWYATLDAGFKSI